VDRLGAVAVRIHRVLRHACALPEGDVGFGVAYALAGQVRRSGGEVIANAEPASGVLAAPMVPP
jgi:hypothetical protein